MFKLSTKLIRQNAYSQTGSATDCVKQLNETKNNKTTFFIFIKLYIFASAPTDDLLYWPVTTKLLLPSIFIPPTPWINAISWTIHFFYYFIIQTVKVGNVIVTAAALAFTDIINCYYKSK
jgi:hypothetical protein